MKLTAILTAQLCGLLGFATLCIVGFRSTKLWLGIMLGMLVLLESLGTYGVYYMARRSRYIARTGASIASAMSTAMTGLAALVSIVFVRTFCFGRYL